MGLETPTYLPANNLGSVTVVIVAYACAVVAATLIALRFIARKMKGLSYGVDDWLILAALPAILGHNGIVIAAVYYGGVGHRVATLSMGNLVTLQKIITAMQFSFGSSLGFVKASIVCLLMRVFPVPRFKFFATLILVYVTCWGFMCMLVGAFLCRPFAKNWDTTLPGKCGSPLTAFSVIAATDMAGDLMIVILPMTNVWKLQTNLKTKLALSLIFGIGLLDVIVSVLRIVYLVDLFTAPDFTYACTDTAIWATLEPTLAVVVACLPTLKPLTRLCGGGGNGRTTKTSARPLLDSAGSASSSGSSRSFPEPKKSEVVELSSWSPKPVFGGPPSKTWVTVGEAQEHGFGDEVSVTTNNGSVVSVNTARSDSKKASQYEIRIDQDVTVAHYHV